MSTIIKKNKDFIYLLIILSTTFIPSSGSFGFLKLIIVLILSITKKRQMNVNNVAQMGIQIGKNVILLWVINIILATVAVLITESYFNTIKLTHEFSRIIYYTCVIFLCFKISITLKQLFFSCSAIILIHLIIQITQYLGMGTFDVIIQQFYLNGELDNTHYLATRMLYGESFRSGSIFINPNVYVCYPYLSLGVFLEYYRRTNSYLPLIMVGAAFVSVVLTGSRMGMVSFICIVSWFMWYSTKHNSKAKTKNKNKVFIAILAIVIILIFNWEKVSSFSETLRAFRLDSAYESSGSTKMEGFRWYLKLSNPLYWMFGSLGSNYLRIAIDMEWGYIFAWFGVIGLVWYIKLLKLIYRYHKSNFRIISTVACISIVLTGFGASSILNMSVFPYISAIAFTNIIPETT